MKLLAHNFLASAFLKGVTTGYPLKLFGSKVEVKPQEFNGDFVRRMLGKLEWTALKGAADSVGHGADLPTSAPADTELSDEILRRVHHVLLEVEVVDGYLECPESGRKFPIKNGIPNMLVTEEEV